MQVVNVTTPANFYHLLRRQMKRNFRKPLVVMTPKSLLRHPKVQSPLEDLANGSFRELIDDPRIEDKATVKKLFFCSGKIYYDIDKVRDEELPQDRAFIRLEQLYPLAENQISDLVASYPNVEEVYWAQEEPRNMGASWYVQVNFPVKLKEVISPAASASTAPGSSKLAASRYEALLSKIFNA